MLHERDAAVSEGSTRTEGGAAAVRPLTSVTSPSQLGSCELVDTCSTVEIVFMDLIFFPVFSGVFFFLHFIPVFSHKAEWYFIHRVNT